MEKNLLQQAAILKRFQYLPLYSELKKQTSIAKVQCQRLGEVYEFNK